MRNVNARTSNVAAKQFVVVIVAILVTICVFGIIFGACMGCRELIISTGREIVHDR